MLPGLSQLWNHGLAGEGRPGTRTALPSVRSCLPLLSRVLFAPRVVSHFLSHCGPHCRPRLLAHGEAQGTLFPCPDEIASMPVSLQTVKPAADRANPRIGIGALAFSPDNYFLATRNGQWPVPCVCCPPVSLLRGPGLLCLLLPILPLLAGWMSCSGSVWGPLPRAAAAQAQASVPSAPCLGKSRAPGPQGMPPFPAPRHNPGEGGHPH